MTEKLKIKSIWDWEQYRDGELIDAWQETNLVVNEGLNNLLDVYLSSGTQITTWYAGIFDDNHTPASNNTYATPGFSESTAYDEAVRPTWQEAGPSAKSITNSANKASFTMSTTTTIYGGFLVGGGTAATTKGNTAGNGTLLCSSKFSSSKTADNDDVLKVTITITSADA